jgi:hypothetical protein
MSAFRCYMTDAGGHFRDVVSLEAASDLEALTQARALPTAYAGFELWSGPRLIYCQPASARAGIKNQEQTKASFGAGLKAVRTKLERIAASIGDTLPGARSPAVARPKEKRRPRR